MHELTPLKLDSETFVDANPSLVTLNGHMEHSPNSVIPQQLATFGDGRINVINIQTKPNNELSQTDFNNFLFGKFELLKNDPIPDD